MQHARYRSEPGFELSHGKELRWEALKFEDVAADPGEQTFTSTSEGDAERRGGQVEEEVVVWRRYITTN